MLPEPARTQVVRDDVELAVWHWGNPAAPPVVLVHGWGDSGATFAAVAASLHEDFFLIAPDLRGYGESPPTAGGYWFPDYLRDLDACLDALSGTRPVTLVGHSMGGNVCGLYAGIRPARIASLVLLEGFGLPPTSPDEAPDRYRRWLDQTRQPPALRDFVDEAALMRHLQRLAPTADEAVLRQVLPRWAKRLPDGAWRLRMDPAHKGVHAVMYRREEAAACWRATTAPVTLVAGSVSDYLDRFRGFDPLADCAQYYPACTRHVLAGAGHMLHWEQPQAVAALIRAAAQRAGA